LFSANLIEEEQEELELQYKKLSNVEFIKENLSKAIAIADDEQFGVLIGLKEIKSALQKNAAISAESSNLFERIASVLIEFDDVQKELVSLSELTLSDPEELERVNQKLKLIYDLQKKHQVNSITELIAMRESLNDKVVSVLNIENDILSLEKELVVLEKELNQFATSLHENRQKAIPVLTEKMLAILHDLGMANARFDIQLIAKTDFQSNGKDDISFLFSANKGGDFGLLKKVASGGEMSRIMLAVKSILAEYSNLPTIIFDEIDTGVSGEIADKMGDIMRKMSQNMQVFAITHLPQIAAKGSDHFEVYKVVDTEQTRTELRLLSKEQRIQEVAKMLSGANVSESALNHAKELLN
jgi:DNA repair protein RecN (Recombination protein N)